MVKWLLFFFFFFQKGKTKKVDFTESFFSPEGIVQPGVETDLM
uniref:Uncharacterized protein n=1 Tax=Anguilla anguilla TaxID=7936 RepID=A0A0E9SQS8_ANGAN